MSLVYHFRATFTDGSTFDQNEEDTARLEHDRAGLGSSFTDVLWLIEQGKRLSTFVLIGPHGPVAGVYLASGVVELCGNSFYAGDAGLDDADLDRSVVYFRQVQQIRTQTVDAATGEALSDWQELTITRYFLGWSATLADGREVRHVIGIE